MLWQILSIGLVSWATSVQGAGMPSQAAMVKLAVWRNSRPDDIEESHWRPDKKWLAYVLTESREDPEDWRRVSLCAIRSDGKQARRLFVGGTGNDKEAEFATWAPDGQHVLYWENVFGAMSVNADGNPLWDVDILSGRRRQLSGPDPRGRDAMVLQEPEWIKFSANGRSLLMVMGGSRFPYFAKRIRAMDYRTLKGRWLTPRGQASVDPAWSPDAKRIACAATPEDQSHPDYEMGFHIWVVSNDGRERHRLTNNSRCGDRGPEWTRDGKHLRFTRTDANSNRSLWEIGSDGKGLRRLKALPKDSTNASQ